MRRLSELYALSVFLTASWALWTEFTLRNSTVEHMLPAAILVAVTMPISLVLFVFAQAVQLAGLSAFQQVLVLTIGGGIQAWALYWFTHRPSRHGHERQS